MASVNDTCLNLLIVCFNSLINITDFKINSDFKLRAKNVRLHIKFVDL